MPRMTIKVAERVTKAANRRCTARLGEHAGDLLSQRNRLTIKLIKVD